MVEDISRNVNVISQHSHTNSSKMQGTWTPRATSCSQGAPAQVPGADLRLVSIP